MSDCQAVGCDERAVVEVAGYLVCGPHQADYKCYEKPGAKPLTPSQKKAAVMQAKDLDEEDVERLVDLEWWFEVYQDDELPGKFMNKDDWLLRTFGDKFDERTRDYYERMVKDVSPYQKTLIGQRLKDSDGAEVNGGTHVWRWTGLKHYKRDGKQNHFRCVPVAEDTGPKE